MAETALIMPVASLMVVAALFATFLAAQSTLTYVTSEEAADRAAHVWDNSHKHPATGMYSLMDYDPLYWRWRHDGADQWLGFVTGKNEAVVEYPYAEGETAGALPERKLAAGAFDWPAGYSGNGRFENEGIFKSVTMIASVSFRAPPILGLNWPEAAIGNSSESIVEPAEYIRNIELLLGYLPQVNGKYGPDTMRNTLAPWIDKQEVLPTIDRTLTFRYHDQAAKYVKALVRGSERRIPTEETGSWRLIDAMDRYGVAHQTYIGPKTTHRDTMSQLKKDAELIRSGKLNGVVWHFFRRTGETSAGPSESLKRELRKHGITFVIHT
ncbi:hypothetical protein MO973_19470 [Paenibacillus sp. TRM 82003]|nr:hypothetical protein [Paenibacillus sp. TRM 82003]